MYIFLGFCIFISNISIIERYTYLFRKSVFSFRKESLFTRMNSPVDFFTNLRGDHRSVAKCFFLKQNGQRIEA